MIDPALSSLGARVVLATSSDEIYPPENIIDGNTETFWISTGMFPQEFIICFAESMKISRLTMHCYNVKTFKLEKSISDDATDFEPISENELEHMEGHLQTSDIPLNEMNATHLRFIITSGHDHFISVHRISVER
ncbi:hypothetical protein UPYG_G00189370 [Umbra pygmaea]|uniref:Intraflagellar transport protein 25 homolog n=1 Tax=Umbra pygmaea TaxID=75934 RepID=A0ABD0XB18_UMBPY